MKMISDKTDKNYCKDAGRDGLIGPERESFMHGRGSVLEQAHPGRYHATVTTEGNDDEGERSQPMIIDEETYKELFDNSREFDAEGFEGFPPESPIPDKDSRKKWNKEVNKIIMECFYRSDPTRRGYRKRMLANWKEIGVFECTEQRIVDQSRCIRTNEWLSSIELEEIQRKVESGVNHGDMQNEGREIEEDVIEQSDDLPETEIGMDEVTDNMVTKGYTEEEIQLVKEIMEQMEKDETPMNMRNVERDKLVKKVKEIDKVLKEIPTERITDTNKVLNAAGCIVGKKLGVKKRKAREAKEPEWKKRLNMQINELRKDLSRLQKWKENQLLNTVTRERLERKYSTKKKGLSMVIEEVKQRVIAKAAKVKRYEGRNEQYRQNRLYQSNQKRLFELIEKKERNNDIVPDAEESKNFWNGIWNQPVRHNADAKWLNDVKEELKEVRQQDEVHITAAKVKKQLRKMPNWKAPGPDGVRGFWFKQFLCLHSLIAKSLHGVFDSQSVPDWLVKGRNVFFKRTL